MSALKANAILNAGVGNTATINGMTPTADSLQGFRNRLINGGMAVDQRNAGASQTITAAAALAYTVDRWYAYCTGANVTGQRVDHLNNGGELQDADGNVMSADEAKEFVKGLP